MKTFKEFNLKPAVKKFTGEKIKISKVLNKEIVVHDYKIEDSKFEGKGKCLFLQIELDGAKRVVFTGSTILTELIQQIASTDFPFITTIVEIDEHFEFN
jgi:hypothetical protein